MSVTRNRETFSISRAAEYFDARELQAQTGQSIDSFAAVVLKELLDNALDAAEAAGVAPAVLIDICDAEGVLRLEVSDNGAGIRPEVVDRILDFTTRTSDKSAYRTPTRGAQGNALKTVLGIPCALGGTEPVTITAHGICHTIRARIDPGGDLRIDHSQAPVPVRAGTRISVALPSRWDDVRADRWAQAFSLFNPHASVQIRELAATDKQC